ncbi:AAA family ATPase [Dactylosporangium aurantiacum]|uniref:AAA family ATPase n=1 Tax=Dactylosporangium aurantiacum TaxID=35754 RepID=A0A9Q9ISE5_9ACTN|nr:AAA family ATPase [Dactylosporangium aurantiacum]MDG6110369.1 AAA family ATPase [Dactylosporangium aurantiacum]UWZ58138.1 AAA family ATPase [Dactylosporangium aurantiacum]
MARLIHLNGPPGIGKSTLSALYADRNPGTLNLDVDAVHRLVGGWQDEDTDTWPVVWSLVRAMAKCHLEGGRDVVLPQYHAKVDEVVALETLAHRHGAGFREVVLLVLRGLAENPAVPVDVLARLLRDWPEPVAGGLHADPRVRHRSSKRGERPGHGVAAEPAALWYM